MLGSSTLGTLNGVGFPKPRRELIPQNCLALQSFRLLSQNQLIASAMASAISFTFKWNAVLLESFFFFIILLQFYFGLAMKAGNKPNAVSLKIFQNCGQSRAALYYVWSHELANSSISQDSPVPAPLRLLDSPGSLFCQEQLLSPRHLLMPKITTWSHSACQAASYKFM